MKHRPRGRIARCLGAALTGILATGTLTAIAVPTALAGTAEEQRPSYLGKTLYTGEFHSHTSVSDGVQLPDDAFAHVREETDADFFAVSEHDVMWDLRNGDDFIDDWRDADSEEWRYVHEAVDHFNGAQDELVAVPSIETTWYDGTGHINVFDADWKATARATEKGSVDGFANSFGTGDLKYDMYTFFARLKQDPDAIGQFNHPSPQGKGNFFGFNGLDREVDERMELIEVRSDAQFTQFVKALDTGWHLAPVWNGDEHSATWVTSNQAITGVWATEHSLGGLYAAMRDRSTFSTQDVNATLAFGGNDRLMGSILPADTEHVAFDVALSDPDARDSFAKVELIGNGGQVVHAFPDVSGNDLELRHELDVRDGDYYLLRATQADGQTVVSAPIWIGETTRGADYAPRITVPADYPATVSYGAEIALPAATATDDSGATPAVTYEVYDAAGLVPVDDGTFRVRSYDDHFVVVKAEDASGNIGAELIRLVVDQAELDPAGVFQYFGSTAVVAERAGGTGIAVSTDRVVERVYAQVLPADRDDWSTAEVLTSTNDRPYEVNTIGNDEPTYQHSITGQTLRSHEFDLTGLTEGDRYHYRFGVAVDGSAPAASDAAWTDVQGEFVAGGKGNEPIYAIGDLQATTHDPDDLGLLRDVLARLQEEVPGGRTLLQTGDLVDNGGRGQYWQEVFDHVFDGLDIQYAPVAGNHETYGDLDYNSVSDDRTTIFGNMFDTPKNGRIGESNYSFDRGDVHVAVLNSVVDMDRQLAWLAKDIRASDRTWNVVTGHYSYYGGSHGNDGPLAADRPKLTAAFEKLGVDLYIGGHDHIYKRSTIYDGRLAETPAEEAEGTTFVTLGSAGPKFYGNVVHWWDDVVFDEDTQLGTVLEVVDDGLRLTTYTLDGRTVDTYTVRKPQGSWRVTSTDVEGRAMEGVGVVSHEGSPDEATVIAATYDRTGRTLREVREVRVELDHEGSEQYTTFDTPLPVNPSDTVKVFAWDGLATARPMKGATLVREGIEGQGTAADPYLINAAGDLDKITNDPEGHYLLTTDLDLGGTTRSQLDRLVTFRGVFDGGGHTIRDFTTPETQGVGLFADNYGTVRNLVVEGEVETDRGTVGLVADQNHGLIERVRTAGSIAGATRVGGIVGDHYGTIRDSYSTAAVTTTGLYAGGVVAIAIGGSVTERVYATGTVKATGRNAGGVVSYGYENTRVGNVVSLNERVQAPSFAHAIVGRVSDGQIADLARNYTSSAVTVLGESLTEPPAADNWRGEVVPAATLRTAAFFADLGWDLDGVWEWHPDAKRPLLRQAAEEIDLGTVRPALDRDDDGAWLVAAPDDLRQVVQFPDESYRLAADLDVAGHDLPQLGSARAFNGVLDGDGHLIRGWSSAQGGLFSLIGAEGRVQDLGIVGLAVTKPTARGGGLVDTLRGTVERVWTSGSVRAQSYAGGIAGESFGTIRDSYSTATVATTGGNYAGGIIGVADSPSTTERVYATGVVNSSGTSAGGVSGYARNSATIVRQAFALNPSVTGTTTSQRVVARSANGETATLERLYAVETLSAGVQSSTAVGPQTLNGETRTVAQAGSPATWRDDVGLDLDGVWAWHADGKRPVLVEATEEIEVADHPALEQEDGTWLVSRAVDLQQVALFPAESYRLTADLDLTGQPVRIESFSGSLDGGGHAIRNLAATQGGLFGTIAADGRVHDLGLADVAIAKATLKAGGLVDTLRGTVERVWTSGSVRAHSYAGGIAGESFGTIRDSYSTAEVTATSTSYAGGIVGVADSPSTTERVYATGAVRATTASAGGLAGYARNSGSVVRSGVALNPSVTATADASRIVARFASGQTATLADLYALDTLVPSVQTNAATGPGTLNGASLTAEELVQAAAWTAAGFDLASVWSWDDERGRPVLSGAAGSVVRPAAYRPRKTGPTRVISDSAPARSHEVVIDGDGTATVTVGLGSAAADAPAGILVLRTGADPRAPRAEDIVFVDQRATDAAGRLSFEAHLGASTEGLRLAVGVAGQTDRYLAWLDPQTGGGGPVDPVDPGGSGDLERAVPELTADRLVAAWGERVTLRVRAGGARGPASGELRITTGNRTLATGTLSGGAARVALPRRSLPVGRHVVTASYGGDGSYLARTTTVRVRVTKAAGTLRVATVTPKRIEAKRTRAKVRLRLDAPSGVSTNGTVRIRVAGRTVRAKLHDDVAKVRLPRIPKPGATRLVAVFPGNAEVQPTRASVRIRVVRR
ncbi:metallophosphoesterase [Nocardioides sp. LMS-CY]|uniref:metallophosphoesterase n=1 Tax=Nocardioides sp. (strain LMS-CY) TaxID=2840457 RepID=UPI001C001DC4|nr:metallophosphoesterase [Nocardioides sp. LMS-CY]QWF23315.1 metallophosphoesterase [Nocardioides sp. LMS-CY]